VLWRLSASNDSRRGRTLSLIKYIAQLSSQTAREWTSRFYEKADIKVSKVSHAPRVAATQNADMAGVDEGQACHYPSRTLDSCPG
jgi:hypothetical protein